MEAARVLSGLDDTDDFYFEVLRQVKMPSWSSGRVILSGDATWCATPISGMGTTLTVIGAYALAGELATSASAQEATKGYEDIMRPFVDKGQDVPKSAPKFLQPQTRCGPSAYGSQNCWIVLGEVGFGKSHGIKSRHPRSALLQTVVRSVGYRSHLRSRTSLFKIQEYGNEQPQVYHNLCQRNGIISSDGWRRRDDLPAKCKSDMASGGDMNMQAHEMSGATNYQKESVDGMKAMNMMQAMMKNGADVSFICGMIAHHMGRSACRKSHGSTAATLRRKLSMPKSEKSSR